ncbi:MAG: cytochrome c biogenesis protein CcdA [Nocardioides sp.]|uniref:cytochrome c biogenesis protein CcdA n=1 Tax=Nocardioides sp. TaxID=35761 RepID=UPI0039E4D2C5
MLTLALIGLVGGLITGVSPCVLPMLPIIFFAGAGGAGEERSDRTRPLKIIVGVVTSFSVFTLLGSTILSFLGLPDDFLRWAGIAVLALVGIGMLIPALGHLIERPFYRLPKVTGQRGGPFVLGLGLGTLYVPCAGPILAAITVAGATGQIGWRTVVLTVSFALGAALPLLIFASAGSNIRGRINAYRSRATAFRVGGGVILIVLAVALAFNATDALQRAVPNYTGGLEKRLATSDAVQGALTPFETEENKALSKCTPGADELASCGVAPKLRKGRWLNTPDGRAISLDDLHGKVVLIDFFAYSCINCQRDQPYIQRWQKAYAGAGLEVIGVHSPEFAFEKSSSNLVAAMRKEGTTYPVLQDNELATWTAYRNRYWPAKYLIDRDGTVRAIKFGEGDYAQTEGLIRTLLTDPATGGSGVTLPAATTKVDDPGFTEARTPELYLAANHPGYVGSPKYVGTDRTTYAYAGASQPQDTYGLAGPWSATSEHLVAEDGSQLRLHFRGRDVYHVLAGSGTVTISEPGKPDRTIDVSGTPNLYPLITGDDVLDETITLTYGKGIEAYTFTFG